MANTRSSRPKLPTGLLLKPLLPFALPMVATFALVLLVGDRWPRDIAPGSGLKLAGLAATMATAFGVWRYAVRGVEDERVGRVVALLCAVTGLMGWPVWTTGVLPSVNGARLGSERTVRMDLERLETTTKSKSRGLYHWAWLAARDGEDALASGRYFLSETVYDTWQKTDPAEVHVTVARGFLGAQVVMKFD
jgi:hypothetical protein